MARNCLPKPNAWPRSFPGLSPRSSCALGKWARHRGRAKEQGVELLVMGHHKPHPHALSETLLGGIGRYVAHHASCRVIVQIPAPEHK